MPFLVLTRFISDIYFFFQVEPVHSDLPGATMKFKLDQSKVGHYNNL